MSKGEKRVAWVMFWVTAVLFVTGTTAASRYSISAFCFSAMVVAIIGGIIWVGSKGGLD